MKIIHQDIFNVIVAALQNLGYGVHWAETNSFQPVTPRMRICHYGTIDKDYDLTQIQRPIGQVNFQYFYFARIVISETMILELDSVRECRWYSDVWGPAVQFKLNLISPDHDPIEWLKVHVRKVLDDHIKYEPARQAKLPNYRENLGSGFVR